MIYAAAVAALVFAVFWAACWWGSEVVFHPPKMLAHTIWPDRWNLKYETIRFPATDGVPIAGWVIPASQPTKRTILMLHGWGDNKGDLLERTWYLAKKFNLVMIDHRNHGESGGPFSTIGCRESRDVVAAVDWLKRNKAEWMGNLGLFGLSMGGSVALWSAAKWPFFHCAAVEAPFPSFNQVVGRYTYNGFKLPYFPFAYCALLVIKWRLGEDPERYSPIYNVDQIAPRPLLFIAGRDDILMPLPDVEELHRRAGEPKELWVVDHARHGKCEKTAGSAYHQKLEQFFERNIPA
ncbi:MAG: alpha/beta fold hydrolase [Elusimicrobia bacterium]|nr:alpha/beta fold hydrolase [Elusimicrobiota bacterium]